MKITEVKDFSPSPEISGFNIVCDEGSNFFLVGQISRVPEIGDSVSVEQNGSVQIKDIVYVKISTSLIVEKERLKDPLKQVQAKTFKTGEELSEWLKGNSRVRVILTVPGGSLHVGSFTVIYEN